jgi:hypothetical protein
MNILLHTALLFFVGNSTPSYDKMSPHTSTNPHLSQSDKETEMERNRRLYYDCDSDVVPVVSNSASNNVREKNVTSFSEFSYRGGPGTVECLSSSSSKSKNHDPSSSSSYSSSAVSGGDDRSHKNGYRYNDLSHDDDDVVMLQSNRSNHTSRNCYNNDDNNNNNHNNNNNNYRSNNNSNNDGNYDRGFDNDSSNGSRGDSNDGGNRQYNRYGGQGEEVCVVSPTLSARRQSSNSGDGEEKCIGERGGVDVIPVPFSASLYLYSSPLLYYLLCRCHQVVYNLITLPFHPIGSAAGMGTEVGSGMSLALKE